MGEEADIDVLEDAMADEVCLARHELLGDAGPEHERAWKLFPLHQRLDRQRGCDGHGLARVVALAVAGRAGNEGGAIGHAGLLGRLWNPVDVGTERDHRFARSPACHPRRRNPRNSALDAEAMALEDAGQVPGGLHFLEAELAEAEEAVHDLLDLRGACLDVRERQGLEALPLEDRAASALGRRCSGH